jgi:hypothetical protein
MPPKPAMTAGRALRKIKSAKKWRDKQKAKGFRQVSVYVLKKHAEKIKSFARLLKEGGLPFASCKAVFLKKKPGVPAGS